LGIPVNVVVSHSDELFDSDSDLFNICLEKIFNNAPKVDSDAVRGAVPLISSINNRRAGHDALWTDSKETTRIVAGLIKEHPKIPKEGGTSSPDIFGTPYRITFPENLPTTKETDGQLKNSKKLINGLLLGTRDLARRITPSFRKRHKTPK
ncbi:MAG: hypothetical protein QG645_63, partial [Patescibacteria group bacterium]|nr:hypothetical protein [Patescibacteria group bacterium]